MDHRTKLTGVLALALLLGSCSLTFWKGDDAATPGSPAATGMSAQDLVRDMQSKMQDTKSGAVKATFNVAVDDSESGDKITIKLGTDGKADSRVKDDASLMLTLMLDVAGTMQGTDVTGNATIDAAVIKKDAYLRISRLTLPEEMQPIMEQIEAYMDTWYIFADAVTQAEDAVASEGDLGALFAGEDATEEQQKQMRALIERTNFFQASMDDASVKVDGVSTQKVNVQLNKPEIVTFAKEAGKIMKEELSSSDLSDLEKGLKEIDFEGSLFIGETDHLLYKATGMYEPAAGSSIREQGMFSVEFEMTLTGHGKDQGITAPEGAVEFDPSAIEAMFAPPSPSEYDPSAFEDYEMDEIPDMDAVPAE